MIENLLYAFILVFSLTLVVIAFQAYRRSGNVKILLVAIAFLLFLVRGILLVVQLFMKPLTQEMLWIVSGMLDLGILGLIFLAVLRR